MKIAFIIFGVILLLGIVIVFIYNGLVRLKNRLEEALSDMDVQMKRRYDLIPNLVETVKGYATHEKETLELVIKARNEAMGAQESHDIEKIQKAENSLSGTLKSIFALSESYPDLKANQNFLELQRELTDTEDKIMASRRFYNSIVRDFNTKLQVFPTNTIAKLLNFTPKNFFAIENNAEREAVKVKF